MAIIKKKYKPKYKLLFANQSIHTTTKFELVNETPSYVFLKQIGGVPSHVFRVHKRTLSVKGIKLGKDGYKWDIANAIRLEEVKD